MQDVRDALARQWWVRAMADSRPEGIGLILRSAIPLYLGNPRIIPDNPPWAGPAGVIDARGLVRFNYVDAQNRCHFAWPWGSVEHFKDELLWTAERLAFTADEARALFEAARAWIKADARPDQEQSEDRVPEDQR